MTSKSGLIEVDERAAVRFDPRPARRRLVRRAASSTRRDRRPHYSGGAPPSRLDALTSLRFLAALFVVLHHVFGPDDVPVLRFGYLGVTFFFVLSGFVLTWSDSTRHGVGAFYRNRWARVWPLHVLTMLIALLMPFGGSDDVMTLVQNLTLTQAWTLDGAHSLNWVSWSVSGEAFFYLLFPLALLVLRNKSTRTLTTIAIGALLAQLLICQTLIHIGFGERYFFTYDFPPYRFFEFLIGICLAGVLRRTWADRPWSRWVQGACALYVVALLALLQVRDLTRPQLAIAVVPVVVVVVEWAARSRSNGRASWLRAAPMVKLGEWSFALYLVHALMIRATAALLGLPAAGGLPLWSGLGVVLGSIALAAALSTWFEQPLERLLRAARSKRA